MGKAPLKDAPRRTMPAAKIARLKQLLVHAKVETAAKSHGEHGFEPTRGDPL